MEALLYRTLPGQKVQCGLCRHFCIIKNGQRGFCGVRENQAGKLVSLVYGMIVSGNIDPIEKKPIFHMLPGSRAYSIGTVGCNFKCDFCQNYSISRFPSDNDGAITGTRATPEEIIEDAVYNNCQSIAYTYNEPAVFFEFVLETAKAAKKRKLNNILVSNGYMSDEAVDIISPYIDAANIDLKSFSKEFYRDFCGADLEQVKKGIKTLKYSGVFIEITTLVIPCLNDSREELEAIANFIKTELGPETPWHVSRFHPAYKMNQKESTPVETVQMARNVGLESGLYYVYTGNIPGDEGENTYCRNCEKPVIKRFGYKTENLSQNGLCPNCGTIIDGVNI